MTLIRSGPAIFTFGWLREQDNNGAERHQQTTVIRSDPSISHWGDSKINTESSFTDQKLTFIRSDHSVTDFTVSDC